MSTRPRPSGRPFAPLGRGSSPLLIGYGNPLRSDDGFGRELAQRLAGLLPEHVATVLAVHQLTPELAEPISRASSVLFVDAREDGPPGALVETGLVQESVLPAAFSHDVDPAALLALARMLYGRRPPAVVLSVGGAEFGYGVGLSATVESVMPSALKRAAALLGVPGVMLDEKRVEPCTR